MIKFYLIVKKQNHTTRALNEMNVNDLPCREYKPPASFDIPEDLRVSLYEWDKSSGILTLIYSSSPLTMSETEVAKRSSYNVPSSVKSRS